VADLAAHPLGELALVAEPGTGVEGLRAELAARGVSHHVVAPGQVAGELASGIRYLAHCGGLASLTTYLPALVETEGVVLGLYPAGKSNDFALTFGLDLVPAATAIVLAGPRVQRVDVGLAEIGGERRYLLNEAVVGLGAAAARKAERLHRAGRAGRLLAWWAALATYRPRRTDVDMTFAEWHDELVQVRLSNGQWALDRLHAAPRALPDDGAWDVQVWHGPRHLPFTLQPAMVRGDHLPHERVAEWRQRRVEIATPGLPVAVDGRYAGRTPATFEMLPGRLRLKI
jgi:diacylglycerol kinase (ATP)